MEKKLIFEMGGHFNAILLFLLLTVALVCYPVRYTTEHVIHVENQALEEYVTAQENYSWLRILDNIHPEGTSPGCIVASPSRKDPDYWYQWTRDSAITMKTVVQRYIDGNEDLLPLILDYVNATDIIQHLHTQSGNYHTGGLGEPKYDTDHTSFNNEWGRPQRDGPALRATVLMAFAREYIKRNGIQGLEFVESVLYAGHLPAHTIIKADMEYVANNWYLPGFDIWEEVYGHHAFTLLVSMRALREGGYFAMIMDDPGAAHFYFKQADAIHDSLVRNHIIHDAKNEPKILRATSFTGLSKPSSYKRSGLDSSVIIAVNQLHSAGYITGDSAIIDPWNSTNKLFFNTHNAVVKSMRDIYPINQVYDDNHLSNQHYHHHTLSKPGAVGRYSEDIYDGVATSTGNPWYLTTLAHAEFLYNMYHSLRKRSITFPITLATSTKNIDSHYYHLFLSKDLLQSSSSTRLLRKLTQIVFRDLNNNNFQSNNEDDNYQLVTLHPGSKAHNIFISNIFARADSFVNVVKDFKSVNMSLNEQFDAITGMPRGARELTWSHSAFLTMVAARRGLHQL